MKNLFWDICIGFVVWFLVWIVCRDMLGIEYRKYERQQKHRDAEEDIDV